MVVIVTFWVEFSVNAPSVRLPLRVLSSPVVVVEVAEEACVWLDLACVAVTVRVDSVVVSYVSYRELPDSLMVDDSVSVWFDVVTVSVWFVDKPDAVAVDSTMICDV